MLRITDTRISPALFPPDHQENDFVIGAPIMYRMCSICDVKDVRIPIPEDCVIFSTFSFAAQMTC